MANCETCATPMETSGTRLYCPACVLRDLVADEEEDARAAEVTVDVPPQLASGMPVVPKYELIEVVGEGGFAIVYRALQREPVRREVALKVLRPQVVGDHVLGRFETERQTLARMEHPNIARLWDAGTTQDGRPFFAMELVRGEPVTSYCKTHALQLRERLEIFCTICAAVQHAHEKGVLHRDLKPSNILVARHGDEHEVKVIDFGIAKALETTNDSDTKAVVTSFHQAIGTPGYMSPEQSAWGAHHVDVRSDLYALGVVLYQLLTETTPLDEEKRRDITARNRPTARDIVNPSTLSNSLLRTRTQQRDLDAIALKALAWESTARYASADAFAEDVRRHLDDLPVRASQHSWRYVIGKFSRRHLPLVAGLTVAAAAVIAGLTTSTILFFREQKAHLHAVAASAMLEQREKETRRVLSRADFATAQRMKAEGDHQGAVAQLTRALLNDPEFGAAGADLQMLLTQADFPQPLTPPVPLPVGWDVAEGAVSAEGTEFLADAIAEDGRHLVLCRLVNDSWQTSELPVMGTSSLLNVSGNGRFYSFVKDGKVLQVGTVEAPTPEWSWQSSSPILAVAMSTTGPRLAAGCADGSVWLWDAGAERQPRKLGALGDEVTHIKIIGNDRSVIAACTDGTVHRLVDPGNNDTVLMRMPARVTVLTTPGTAGIVAIGDSKGNVACCRENGEELMKQTRLHEGRVMAVTVAGSAGAVISAGADLTLHWVEMETRKDLEAPVESGGFVAQLLVSRAGDEVMVVGADSSLRIWRREGRGTVTVRKPQRSRFVAMSAAGKAVALKREQGRMIEVLGLSSHAALGVQLNLGGLMQNPGTTPIAAAFLQGGRELVSSLSSGTAVTWNTAAAKIARLANWPAPAHAVGPAGDRKVIAAFADGSLIEAGAEPPSAVPLAGADQANDPWDEATLSADGHGAVWAKFARVRTGLAPPQLRVWTRTAGVQSIPGVERLSAVAIRADGPILACGMGSGYLRLITPGQQNEELLKSLHQGRITDVAFSPDGRMLLSSSSDGTASLWDVEQLTPLSDYLQFGEPVLRVAFSGDGQRFACATAREVVVGNVATHSILGLPFNLPIEANVLALNHDGSRVAFGLRGGIVAFYDVAPEISHPPDWFLKTANALASRRFNSSNVLEATEHPGLVALRQTMPSPPGKDAWSQLSSWLFAPTATRALSPWSGLTTDEYAKAITSSPPSGGSLKTDEQ